jgi:hypothetical protein
MELFDMLRSELQLPMRFKIFRSGWRPLVDLLACLMGGILSAPGMAITETVNLPLTIDYPLLRSLVVASVFTNSGETTSVLDENGGCRRITLSSPKYRSDGPHLLFEVKAQPSSRISSAGNSLTPGKS